MFFKASRRKSIFLDKMFILFSSEILHRSLLSVNYTPIVRCPWIVWSIILSCLVYAITKKKTNGCRTYPEYTISKRTLCESVCVFGRLVHSELSSADFPSKSLRDERPTVYAPFLLTVTKRNLLQRLLFLLSYPAVAMSVTYAGCSGVKVYDLPILNSSAYTFAGRRYGNSTVEYIGRCERTRNSPSNVMRILQIFSFDTRPPPPPLASTEISVTYL